MKNKILISILDSDFGKALIATRDDSVCGLLFGNSEEELVKEIKSIHGSECFQETDNAFHKDIISRINSNCNDLDELKIDLIYYGSPFERKVWNAIRTVSRGKRISYTLLATQIGHPNAVRAVGTACGKNPISVIVPCHRVVPSGNKKIGNYRWRIEMKKRLLDMERI